MTVCSSCSTTAPEFAKFCPKCGAPLTADAPTIDRAAEAGDATLHKPVERPVSAPSQPVSQSSGSLPHGRFLPGMMIGGRYRIVSILGRGGMGEVYRADDLSLGQQVALKFLPQELASDPERLNRFRQEVRIARQVSHPNVCRVYDIGEIEGEHFISMEYVEGEDLGQLLKRIGQLPETKAIQIARQLAAGLAAAHDRNLVHRDLKPANIMLDERGMVRITDFGLAATAEELEGGAAREGTPQYMAPEQLGGKAVTVRSDIYSLGLVLYELFTGKRAFDAKTLSELIQVREESDVSSLSRSLEGLDPAVERVIMHCLEPDPARRPQSALAVSAALPGGDPLAAAIAAGETPSPEMVAAAGEEGALGPRTTAVVFALSLAGLIILPFLSQWSGARPPLTLRHGPEVMKNKAREMLERLGFESEPADIAYGYFNMDDWLDYLEENDSSEHRWKSLDEREHPLFGFWYRESPVPLVNSRFFYGVAGGVVSFSAPYPRHYGEIQITIDDHDRLWSLRSVPPQVAEEGRSEGDGDPFAKLLEEAGLDPGDLAPAEPQWTPTFHATERRAWTGELEPGIGMRIEAAVYEAQPVYFTRIFEWTEPQRMGSTKPPLSQTIVNSIQIAIFLLIVGGAMLMARRNIRMGRGDRRGAFRLAALVFVTVFVLWVLTADHVASVAEFGLLIIALAWAMFLSSIFWLVYVALEPYIRRRWPGMLISWSRLLGGRIRDPLVGRDLLIGTAIGILINLLIPHAMWMVHQLSTGSTPRPRFFGAGQLEGTIAPIAAIGSQIPGALAAAFFVAFLLFLILLVMRREWLAGASVVLICSVISTLGSQGDWIAAVFFTTIWTALVLALIRFGMLAVVIAIFSANSLQAASGFPMTGALTTVPVVISIGTALALLASGFVFALGGRSLVSSDLIDR